MRLRPFSVYIGEALLLLVGSCDSLHLFKARQQIVLYSYSESTSLGSWSLFLTAAWV